jgi:glycine/D-amino acid oxidase-like deaminating enzyme
LVGAPAQAEMRAIEAREEDKRRVAMKAAAEELEGVKGELAETSRLQRVAEKDLGDLKQRAEREGADLKEEVRKGEESFGGRINRGGWWINTLASTRAILHAVSILCTKCTLN